MMITSGLLASWWWNTRRMASSIVIRSSLLKSPRYSGAVACSSGARATSAKLVDSGSKLLRASSTEARTSAIVCCFMVSISELLKPWLNK